MNGHFKRMHRIYMAGPLFTTAERRFNLQLAGELRRLLPAFDFVLPQERAVAFLPDLSAVVTGCLAQVRGADGLLSCLDGPDADPEPALRSATPLPSPSRSWAIGRIFEDRKSKALMQWSVMAARVTSRPPRSRHHWRS
jgi:hypothetical protein